MKSPGFTIIHLGHFNHHIIPLGKLEEALIGTEIPYQSFIHIGAYKSALKPS